MKKTTKLAGIKVRWLGCRSIILLLLFAYFPYLNLNAQTFSYTGAVQTVTLAAGDYEIEMWGADGGKGFQSSSINNEGKGGYSKGILTVTTPTTYYIYVGGKGTNAAGVAVGDVYFGGWNGGGDSGQNNYSTVTEYRAGGGGGGTDIRTTLNNTYANRLMVAGGGGGGVYLLTYPGGNGGGAIGGNSGNTNFGAGGSQTAGGVANGTTGNIAGTNGALGIGGNGGTASTKSGGGGGGGGYYGGGGGATGNTSSSQGGGGGGSSYLGGVATGVTFMYGTPGFVTNPDTTGNGRVIITTLLPCAGTPNAGIASATSRNCASQSFILSVAGATKAGGITYQWQRSNAGANTFTNIAGATSATYSVTNQTVDSDYRFVVTCANGGGSSTSNVVTVTQIPTGNISENFDTTPVGTTSTPSLPICWSFIDNVATSGYLYTYDLASSAPFSGANYVRMYRTNSTTNATQELVMISPETINLGNGTKQLRFYVKTYGTSATTYDNKLEILSMPSSTSTAGATVLATFTPNHIGYQEYIVPLPAGTNDFFGFRLAYNGNTTASSVSIDDIYYENRELCFFATNLAVPTFAQTTATLSWAASVDTNVTGYSYEVRSSGTPGSGATGLAVSGTVIGATTTTTNITGLNPSTKYSVYIRSVCGTSTGRWNPNFAEFTTLCAVSNGFYENFDTTAVGSTTTPSLPLCWSFIDDVVTSGYLYTYDLASSAPQSGTNYVRMYRTNSTTNSTQELVMISPETNNLGNGAKQIRFSVKTYGTSATTYVNKLEVLSMSSATSTTGATVLATFTPNQIAYQEYVVQLPAGTNDYFGFRLAYNGVTTASSVSIDDVYYEDIPAPTLTTTQTNNLCFGEANGMGSVVVKDGAMPLTYSWSPSGGTTATATGLAAGTYTVTVTDALSRTATATVTITEPAQILSNSVITQVSCNGSNNGSITIAPTGGTLPYTYLWSTGATTGTSLSNLTPGAYSITITDVNGCTATENITITEPTVLTTANSAQTNVSWYGGNDGSATVSATGGTAPYTYSWSNGATGATASNLIAGTYTVIVTDANGCTSSLDFIITQPIPLMVQSVSQTNVSCNAGTNGTAAIVAMGGNAPYTYLWSNGATTAAISNLAAGTYTVTVTDSTGNTITESFTITEPAALASTMVKTDITCNFASNGTATVSVTGGTAPYTYFWSNGMTSATANNLNVGTYSVQITDANGCKTTATVSITQPTALVAALTSTNISCYGQVDGTASVTVSGGTAPYTYSWSNGQTGTSLSSLAKGTYTLTVTDANNCTVTQSFTINEPAFVHPPVALNQSFCIGQNATLANMVITGSNIKWYSAASAGTLLPATTVLTNGTTYYASQTVGTCESATRTAVQVTLNQGAPLTTTQLNVCSNTRVQNMTIDGFNFTQLRWYSSATSTVVLPSSQLLTTTTYYVSSIVGTCESTRQAIQVTVAAAVPAPTATSQVACGNSTLNDLVVTKDPSATLQWYSSMQSMIPLAGTTQVATGTYYVQQVIGACESVRIAVAVQVINVTTPTMTSIATCDGNTIADLHPSTGTYVWYVNNTTTTALPDTFVVKSGTYYIAHEVSGCISPRTNVSINVNARPGNATGQSNQLFGFAAKVSDLKMNQQNVSWFASFNDAVKQVNQLAASQPLQDQTTYYGILTGANNCGSAIPAAVTVTINLSNAALDLTQLKYYPNPVDSELNISYIEEIKKVEVFTITGQRVFGNDYQGNEVKVDLSRLSAGTYLVKIETAKASQFVKIVKK